MTSGFTCFSWAFVYAKQKRVEMPKWALQCRWNGCRLQRRSSSKFSGLGLKLSFDFSALSAVIENVTLLASENVELNRLWHPKHSDFDIGVTKHNFQGKYYYVGSRECSSTHN